MLALEVLVTPAYMIMTSLEVASPWLLAAVLAAGGYGLATGSTLVAAIIAQARSKGTLFSVLSFPILLPLLVLGVELTRGATAGDPGGVAVPVLLLYERHDHCRRTYALSSRVEPMKTFPRVAAVAVDVAGHRRSAPPGWSLAFHDRPGAQRKTLRIGFGTGGRKSPESSDLKLRVLQGSFLCQYSVE